ncbi:MULTISPECIES: phage major capsid protein [Bacillus cereus group]|uniref:phage major capsid protein n=1 Tax=Bacillus cereus group TaxID=86661 RepID=UPI000BED3DDF|nr:MULTISPECIES: phage major capsid protein [Bacillus cereus group]MBJ8079040.1 phage major capsid protein [Bacillus cereus group sp. N12]MDF9449472.1 phage major capsid protein [Bacillus toyonensis]MDG1562537.1 phage major capsid protein [Bacillus toyonensis]PDY91712.1 phage major capsid protein [Bacillus toyonensis]PGE60369.1 phage major capsid protein [Bacillus toyonensis]
MVIKFNNFEEKKLAFAKATQEGTTEEQSAALNSMIEALATDVRSDILNQVNESMVDRSIMQSRGANVLTSEEMKFFNAVVEEGGFKSTETLPKTTQERIFDDLVEDHPLLQHIGLENLGAVTEFIYGDPEGAAVWGPLFDGIKGQLNATFRKDSISQLKLTAFIPLANDMLKLGPVWVERYVRTMITEAMKVGLERGFVAGTGKNEPIGLLKDPSGSVVNGVYPDKKPVGTLTFEPGRKTINELKSVVKLLAKKLNADGSDADRPKNIAGKVVMVTNPFDTFDIQANATIQNAAGVYVTSLPFNPILTESVFVPQGKVLFFVKGQYVAAMGGTEPIKKYEETLALEDATVYIAKQYATGKPKDKYTSQVYTLKLEEVTPPTQG